MTTVKLGMAKATIYDVAARAGVSLKTVSRVINNEPHVREQTQKKVLAAVKALDYHPSLSARGLASNRSDIIGLLYDNSNCTYIVDVQNGVLEQCRLEGFDLLIHPCNYLDPALSDEILATVKRTRLAGVILTPPVSDLKSLTRKFTSQQIDFVRLSPGAPNSSSPCVFSDEKQGAFEMTNHLVSLGHTRIGFIVGHPDHCSSMQRLDGYKEALASAGIKIQAPLIRQGDYSFKSGEKCARELLRLKKPPTAIFASNDEMAAGVIMLAHQLGIQIPDQLSVAGYDDSPTAQHIWPSLTSIKQPVAKLAQTAAAILIGRLKNRATDELKPVLDSQLVVRESTGRYVVEH